MDGKSKKVLNFIKKSGSELEALDIAFSLRMDEDAVLKLLNGLKGENLIVEKTDANGKVFYCAAAEQAAPEKRAASKEADDDIFEPKQKKEKAPRIITENEVLDIEDFSPKSAPAPAPAANVNFAEFVPPSPSPIKQAAATPVFQAPPKMESAVPPSPSPIKQAAAPIAAAAPVNAKNDEADIEDFTPKASAKKSKIKEPVSLIDNDDDFEPKAKSSSSLPIPNVKYAAAAVCVLLLLIIAFFMGASSGSGKIKAAVDDASVNFVKTADFQPVKDNANKISDMEAQIKDLKSDLDNVKSEMKKLEEAAKPAAAKKSTSSSRRR